MEKKQTAVEWFTYNDAQATLDYAEGKITELVFAVKKMAILQKALEIERKHIIDFVDWLTRYDSPYAIMWGNEPERFCTENKNFTIEQVYEEYIKRKTETRP